MIISFTVKLSDNNSSISPSTFIDLILSKKMIAADKPQSSYSPAHWDPTFGINPSALLLRPSNYNSQLKQDLSSPSLTNQHDFFSRRKYPSFEPVSYKDFSNRLETSDVASNVTSRNEQLLSSINSPANIQNSTDSFKNPKTVGNPLHYISPAPSTVLPEPVKPMDAFIDSYPWTNAVGDIYGDDSYDNSFLLDLGHQNNKISAPTPTYFEEPEVFDDEEDDDDDNSFVFPDDDEDSYLALGPKPAEPQTSALSDSTLNSLNQTLHSPQHIPSIGSKRTANRISKDKPVQSLFHSTGSVTDKSNARLEQAIKQQIESEYHPSSQYDDDDDSSDLSSAPSTPPPQSRRRKTRPHYSSTKPRRGPHRCLATDPDTGRPCAKVFSRPYDLVRHQDTIHAAVRKHYICPVCVKNGAEEKTFSRTDALARHIRVKHDVSSAQATAAAHKPSNMVVTNP